MLDARVTLVTGGGQDAAVINVSQQVGSSVLVVKDGIERALREQALAALTAATWYSGGVCSAFVIARAGVLARKIESMTPLVAPAAPRT